MSYFELIALVNREFSIQPQLKETFIENTMKVLYEGGLLGKDQRRLVAERVLAVFAGDTSVIQGVSEDPPSYK